MGGGWPEYGASPRSTLYRVHAIQNRICTQLLVRLSGADTQTVASFCHHISLAQLVIAILSPSLDPENGKDLREDESLSKLPLT